MKDFVKKWWKLFVNRETITYAVAGVMTTVVNFLAYHLFCNVMNIPNLVANAIAWVIAVAFAYVVNARWVFLERFEGWKMEWERIVKFTGARVVTFFVEEAGMFLLVDVLHGPNLIMKAIVAVLVIILNYVFSKLFVFISGSGKKEEK
ncbi:MAG: GtrA family protein [Lachnospiraceae bacterium]|nr:GtrA family protein [Lachnospiraceae bacterium]